VRVWVWVTDRGRKASHTAILSVEQCSEDGGNRFDPYTVAVVGCGLWGRFLTDPHLVASRGHVCSACRSG
jgi:hypothetical protein